jgi:hypothetical protein
MKTVCIITAALLCATGCIPDSGRATRNTPDEYDNDGLVCLKKSTHATRDENGVFTIRGTVINRRDTRLTYAEIRFTLYDAAGNQVGTAMANINDLASGAKWSFEAVAISPGGDKYSIASLSGW